MPAVGNASAHAAAAIHSAFDWYCAEFRAITRRARSRFERREWREAQADAVERLTLYRRALDPVLAGLPGILGGAAQDRTAWRHMKRQYARLTGERPDAEIAATFFSSLTRRAFGTVGVNRGIEFAGSDVDGLPRDQGGPVHLNYHGGDPLVDLVRRILDDLPLGTRLADPAGDATRLALALERHLHDLGRPSVVAVELLPSVFYRNKGAYLVGRIRTWTGIIPLVLALLHPEPGIRVDAALFTADEASIVFGFTRSYFHAEVDRPRAVVQFLRSIMPNKRVDELYTSLGYNKHGKTELYRHLLSHLASSDARFDVAEGEKGLVMSVFALPSLQIVFKVIKDRFGYPKNITRQAVMDKYHFVFVRDRVGRLADAQEFEHLALPRDRFHPAVLDELLREARGSVRVARDRVVVRHCYTERLVTPLNLYLRRADPAAARDAMVDYGNAIKDLAAADVFTGDMLLKNFGVTRHGRVIFYDYDELCLLTECQFRRLPEPITVEDELAAEPWFFVGERDVFPEEFEPVVSLPGPVGEAFLDAHRDLLDVGFWRDMQTRLAAGEVIDILPYTQERRL
ncbi:MAG: bifunctional isocitrate dehydrogenase kinase/phosphatase [Gemmatimonadetes bacterium]|nr:bifunctional isocitrate dehydrogenase kinase/phosphatase [Gemmatimonadota bacterium]